MWMSDKDSGSNRILFPLLIFTKDSPAEQTEGQEGVRVSSIIYADQWLSEYISVECEYA